MLSIDLRKVHKAHYTAASEPAVVDVPPRRYLMIRGEGDPNTSQDYRDALETLYPIAYALRKVVKEAHGIAYTVMPLEGLWWVEDGDPLSFQDKSNWQWLLMICQPDEVTTTIANQVISDVGSAKGLAAEDRVRLDDFGDGLSAQILHVGPYAEEQPTIERLHHYIETEGFGFRGRHHEIYLSDARRSAPARLKTIIRQPIEDQRS